MDQADNIELDSRVSNPNLAGTIDGKIDFNDGKQIPVAGETYGTFKVEVYTPPSEIKIFLGAVLHPWRTIIEMFAIATHNTSDERYGPLYKNKDTRVF